MLAKRIPSDHYSESWQHVEESRWNSVMEHLLRRVLDMCRIPVVIVNSRAELLHANAAAHTLIGTAGCVRLTGGRLLGSNPSNTAQLLRQINQVANGRGQPQNRAGCLLDETEGGRWALLAFPLVDRIIEQRIQDDAAALLLIIPLDRPDIMTLNEVLTEFFGLTDAEERVVRQIAGGKSPPEVAVALGLSMPTVRTHLSRIYHKTDTAFQAQLIRLIHTTAVFDCP